MRQEAGRAQGDQDGDGEDGAEAEVLAGGDLRRVPRTPAPRAKNSDTTMMSSMLVAMNRPLACRIGVSRSMTAFR